MIDVTELRRASRRAWTFFTIMWITVVVLFGMGLYALYHAAEQTNKTLACVLSVSPDERAPDLYEKCERKVS